MQHTIERYPERMNGSPIDLAVPPPWGLSRRTLVVLPAIVALAAFAFGASAGGDVVDRAILPLARYLGLVTLAIGLSAAAGAGLYCRGSRRRWLAGQAAGASMSLGAGFVWSASAFGAGFACFATGAAVCALLAIGELDRLGRRRSRSPPRGTS